MLVTGSLFVLSYLASYCIPSFSFIFKRKIKTERKLKLEKFGKNTKLNLKYKCQNLFIFIFAIVNVRNIMNTTRNLGPGRFGGVFSQ